MILFREKRRTKRYPIDWSASLRCAFSNAEQTVPVHIIEISLKGARIVLERLQFGPYHVLINDQPIDYELSIALPEGVLRIPVEIEWYNLNSEKRVFYLGCEFKTIGAESKAVLKRAIQNS